MKMSEETTGEIEPTYKGSAFKSVEPGMRFENVCVMRESPSNAVV